MHTMVVLTSTDPSRSDEIARHLREDVIGWAKRQPGFVSGQWLRSADRRGGMGVVVFASEDTATAAARGLCSSPRDGNRAWNIESVTVYEQLTSA